MRKYFLILALLPAFTIAQTGVSEDSFLINAAARVSGKVNPLTIGGYGQIDYNQPFGAGLRNNGTLEVHRLVLLFGYKYSDKLNFVTEIESEHVNEIYVEQAFLDYKLGKHITFRSGLILIPMGIINEYHEPSAYNGVERPFIDNLLSPTTWRELGAGFTGNIPDISLKYQAYMVNGFAGYKGTVALLDGKNGFRKGRQKGIMAFATTPDFTGRIDFYGLPKTTVGLSVYTGKTESSLYNGLNKSDREGIARADSSVVGLAMAGADFRFNASGISLKGQLYFASISNSSQYNAFTGKDIGSAMAGWYLEAGYDLLRLLGSKSTSLIPFIRYESADTHFNTEEPMGRNSEYNYRILTTGVSLKPDVDVALKTDIQIIKNGAGKITNTFNCGVAVWF